MLFYRQNQVERVIRQDLKCTIRARVNRIFQAHTQPSFRVIKTRFQGHHHARCQDIFRRSRDAAKRPFVNFQSDPMPNRVDISTFCFRIRPEWLDGPSPRTTRRFFPGNGKNEGWASVHSLTFQKRFGPADKHPAPHRAHSPGTRCA